MNQKQLQAVSVDVPGRLQVLMKVLAKNVHRQATTKEEISFARSARRMSKDDARLSDILNIGGLLYHIHMDAIDDGNYECSSIIAWKLFEEWAEFNGICFTPRSNGQIEAELIFNNPKKLH